MCLRDGEQWTMSVFRHHISKKMFLRIRCDVMSEARLKRIEIG